MLVVNPHHWLAEDGSLPDAPPRLRRAALRVAQLIEAGGPLALLHARETLHPCPKRPGGTPCPGLTWVVKREEGLHAFCPTCRADEALIHHWEDTLWADGPMEPVPVELVFSKLPPLR
jgi:hypothetical protein